MGTTRWRNAGAIALAMGIGWTSLSATGAQPAGAERPHSGGPLLVVDPHTSEVTGRRAGVEGVHERVRLVGSVIERARVGDRLDLSAGDMERRTVQISSVERSASGSTWNASVVGDPLGSLSVVEVDGHYRGMLVSPRGVYSLSSARDGGYWWSKVALSAGGQDTHDGVMLENPVPTAGAAATSSSAEAPRGRRVKARIRVMFGFTRGAKREAGSARAVRANAKMVVAQTNHLLANSGLKIKLRFAGLVKTSGEGSGNEVEDAFAMSRPDDQRFDNLAGKARERHRADLVHMFVASHGVELCGGALIPSLQSGPDAGFSAATQQCLPYLVSSHELMHNLGADHNAYPGVTHVGASYAHGFVNPSRNYLTVMGYYSPCSDRGNYNCVRIPFLSSPSRRYKGQPLGTDSSMNNRKIVRQMARHVAGYVR